jgi:hypothetical protein
MKNNGSHTTNSESMIALSHEELASTMGGALIDNPGFFGNIVNGAATLIVGIPAQAGVTLGIPGSQALKDTALGYSKP